MNNLPSDTIPQLSAWDWFKKGCVFVGKTASFKGPSFYSSIFHRVEPYQGVSTLIGIHCIFHLAASLLVWSHQSHVRQKKLLEWHTDRRQEGEEGGERRIHFPVCEMVSHERSRRDSILYLFSVRRFAFHMQTKMAPQQYEREQPSERGRRE